MGILNDLLPHILNGLALGVLFALIALGFTLIVSVMEVINLAHGSLFALGAYLAMTVVDPGFSILGPLHGPWLALPLVVRYGIALVVAPALVALAGFVLELALRRTYGKKKEYGLLLTFGAALVIEEAIRLTWGSAEQVMPTPQAVSGAFLAGGMIYSKYRVFAALFGAAAIVLVWLFLDRTPYGHIIKAGAHDSEMVRALGINLPRLQLLVFGFGAALASEREAGWLDLKRVSPLPTGALLLARIGMSLVFAVIIFLLLSTLAFVAGGVRLPPSAWMLLGLVLVLGTLPFCALGLLIGSLARARSAAGWVNLIYLPMGALSGLWFPLFLMPTVLQKLAYALPAYHLGQLSLAASGQIEVVVWRHVAMLLLFTLVFASLAARALQRSVK